MAPEVNSYINKRYIYWLDYAEFHASLARIPDMSRDLLHIVLLNLLEKLEEKVLSLYQKVKKPYRELDYFILKMIKLNAHSKTSPFHYYFLEHIPIDLNIDPWSDFYCLNLPDQDPGEDPYGNAFLSDIRLLRIALEKTDLLPDESKIVSWTLLHGELIKTNPINDIPASGKYKHHKNGIEKVKQTFNQLKYNE